ncbi:MAG TPA: hypothetical protein VFY26_09015 [Anaerolineales bacterium]|nr:hypothetical protein [Anaerolineales bacterium]
MPHTIYSQSETKHRRPAPLASKASSCGCSSHQETCCQLDCLTQPHFFGGQLLADTDLTQLLTWSQDKFRLSRFRHGWGVVCGLNVQCDSGSQAVRVTSGYALDCCGHDILVCEDTSISLDEACSSLPDPCAMPETSSRGRSAGEGGTIDFFGFPIPKRELHEKILTVRYEEVDVDFETALGYVATDGTADCQPSRRRESFRLTWVDPFDQQIAADQIMENEYKACREVVNRYSAWYQRQPPDWSKGSPEKKWEDISAWLLKWIDGTSGYDAHPLHQFCWLRDRLCTMDEINLKSLDQYVSNVLFWMVQDCRNHTLQSTCRDCTDDQGVPLARVDLWVPKRGDCKVLAIDPYPPHRRPLSLDSWPTRPGWVNIGQALWQSPEQARDLLVKMGLTVVSPDTTFQIAAYTDELQKDRECGLHVRPDEPLSLQVVDTGDRLGKRVVGVCRAPTLEQTLARVVGVIAAASTARGLADELVKKLHEHGTHTKWEEEVLARAEANAKATRVVEDLAKKLRQHGTHDKWEEETFVLAEAAAKTARAVEDLAKKLRDHGVHDKWEEETLALCETAVREARAVEALTKNLREHAASAAKPSG